MYFRLHLGRKAVWILLIVLALLAVYPVIFLSAGSLMGADELEDCLGAVVSGAEELEKWLNDKAFRYFPNIRRFSIL